jgi:hypothetical protein
MYVCCTCMPRSSFIHIALKLASFASEREVVNSLELIQYHCESTFHTHDNPHTSGNVPLVVTHQTSISTWTSGWRGHVHSAYAGAVSMSVVVIGSPSSIALDYTGWLWWFLCNFGYIRFGLIFIFFIGRLIIVSSYVDTVLFYNN